MEVFEIENSEEAIKHDHNPTEMPPEIIIEAIGTDDVKIEVLEINTVDKKVLKFVLRIRRPRPN